MITTRRTRGFARVDNPRDGILRGKLMIDIYNAGEGDTAVIEDILSDACDWLVSIGKKLWEREWLTWEALSKQFNASDFYITSYGGAPAGCMAIVDHDPFIWPEIEKGESLFVHKLAVKRFAAGSGCSGALLTRAKELCALRGVEVLRLDCHALMPRLRAVYERNGFNCVGEGVLFDKYHTAYYEYRLRV